MHKGKWKIAIAALAAVALATPAMAGVPGKYQSTYVLGLGSTSGAGDLQMPADRAGKLKIKQSGSDKDGEGGYVIQIAGNAKFTCASNNDPKKGVCGPKGSPTEAVAMNTWTVLGAVEITNTSRINIEGGKVTFQATGKNKLNAAGNVAASTIYETPVAVGYASINDLGSDPDDPLTGCEAGPVADKTTCAGLAASVAGFRYGLDATNRCTTDEDCRSEGVITLECGGNGWCAVQTCTEDSDCFSDHCNTETGNCCDPNSAVGCPDPSPSGAFLDEVRF